MAKLIDEATSLWHKVDEADQEGDFIELDPEIKKELETQDWISSKHSNI